LEVYLGGGQPERWIDGGAKLRTTSHGGWWGWGDSGQEGTRLEAGEGGGGAGEDARARNRAATVWVGWSGDSRGSAQALARAGGRRMNWKGKQNTGPGKKR